jgi:hypothetical protein
MGGNMASQSKVIGRVSPDGGIELEQTPKSSTARTYFGMARLRRRDAEFNWRRKGFGAKPLTAWAKLQEFTQRKQGSRKMKSL